MSKVPLIITPILFLLASNYPKYAEIMQSTTYMRVTCYTWTGNPTASGVYPEEGMCAGRKEDIGKTAFVYDIHYNFVGAFEITDCGGAYSLQNGTSIDIYRDTLARCYEWVGEYGDYMYVEIR